MTASDTDEMREELAAVAASLRAYLEWQADSGATGIPRRPRAAARGRPPADPDRVVEASVAVPPAVETTVAEAPRHEAPPRARPAPPERVAPHETPAFLLDEAAPRAPRAEAPRAGANPVATRPTAPRQPARPLTVIAEDVSSCTRCALSASRTHAVFARGNPAAKICFVGEAPGADEDLQGKPFVGQAGQLLDRMIGAMGLDPQDDVYVCTIVKCRAPDDRAASASEIESCLPFLHEQLEAVNPKVIIALGTAAAAALLGTKLGIGKVRGSWKIYRGKIPVMATYAPAQLVKPGPGQVDAKKQAWEDLQAVMRELGLKA